MKKGLRQSRIPRYLDRTRLADALMKKGLRLRRSRKRGNELSLSGAIRDDLRMSLADALMKKGLRRVISNRMFNIRRLADALMKKGLRLSIGSGHRY